MAVMNSCGRPYTVTLEKNGVPLRTQNAAITRLAWERVIDNPSAASVFFDVANPDCCGDLGLVDHWNTDLIISSGSSVLWRGPVSRAEDLGGVLAVYALDVLQWLNLRVLEADTTYTNLDTSLIFEDIWNRAVNAVQPPVHTLIIHETGIKETRRIRSTEVKVAWEAVRAFLDTSLDVTTVGSRVLVGPFSSNVLKLTSDDVQGNIVIVKDGEQYANRVLVDAANDIKGVYPDQPRSMGGANGYPLVEHQIYDPELLTEASADQAAASYYDFAAMGIRRIKADGGLILLPSENRDPVDLYAGMLVTFTAPNRCFSATETFRLGRVGFDISGGKETVTIDLQPVGTLRGFNDAGSTI